MKKILASIVSIVASLGFFLPLTASAACSPVGLGGTGWCNIVANTILLGNGTGALGTTTAGTNGQYLMLFNSIPTWVTATSTASVAWGAITGTLSSQLDLNAKFSTKIGTTSNLTQGQLTYITGFNTVAGVATTTLAGGGPITVSNSPILIGSSGAVLGCTNASNGVTGCMTASDWGLLHTATSTFTSPLIYTQSTNAVTCPSCNTSAASVTSISAGTGLTGGTITTAGNIALKSYFSTSTPDSVGQLIFFSSTNGTPATLGASSTLSFNPTGAILTTTNASTTNVSVNGTNINGTSTVTSFISPSTAFTMNYATTTTWTGTSSPNVMNADYLIVPFSVQIWQAICLTDAGTVNGDLFYGATHLKTIALTSTAATTTFTTNNTPGAGQLLQLKYGTPASSPTSASCTFLAVKQSSGL